ncbi:MAG: TonB-dependent receptor plug domain-containing protein [Sandarakinorhabdus sp.]|nr:TonB-dependent receptor plug domain-containing protein [Sandarakinorhabdus sp.]
MNSSRASKLSSLSYARHRLLIGCAAVAMAASAQAQTTVAVAAAEVAAAHDSAAIIVTGSRIARSGFSAPTPVSVIGAAEIKAESPANIADFVNALPSVRGSSTAANSSGSLSSGLAGIASINLRALGASRTLVLFDGQRSVPSSPPPLPRLGGKAGR